MSSHFGIVLLFLFVVGEGSRIEHVYICAYSMSINGVAGMGDILRVVSTWIRE